MSKADQIFLANCQEILSRGTWDTHLPVRPRWEDGTPAHTVKCFGLVNRYDLREEFPIQTIRRMYLKSAVEELLWIWQKKSNNVRALSTGIWDAWADETGSIGKAYGYQMGVKHRYPEGEMDQVDRVLYDLKHNPSSRRILTNLYNHHDLSEMALYPCAYSMTFNVTGNTLNAILHQRSQDMLTANGWNVMQYAVLVHMLAQVSGLEAGELVHVIADAHIYDRHVPLVEELLGRTPYPAPRLRLDPAVTDFYAFTRQRPVGELPVSSPEGKDSRGHLRRCAHEAHCCGGCLLGHWKRRGSTVLYPPGSQAVSAADHRPSGAAGTKDPGHLSRGTPPEKPAESHPLHRPRLCPGGRGGLCYLEGRPGRRAGGYLCHWRGLRIPAGPGLL